MPEENNDEQKQVDTPQEESKDEGEKEPKDRTSEQFDKLKKSNQELKDERDKYRKVLEGLKSDDAPQQQQQKYDTPVNQVPSAQNFQNLNQQQVNDAFSSMVDQDGYLDGNQLMNTLRAMDQRAQQADLRAQQAEKKVRDYEETQHTKEVYSKYPQLDPNSDDFNKDFWEDVYEKMVAGAILNKREPGVNEYLQAAEKVYNGKYADMNKAEKEQKERKEDQKRNINASRPRSPMMKGYHDDAEDEALRHGARTGQRGAVAELLRRAGQ